MRFMTTALKTTSRTRPITAALPSFTSAMCLLLLTSGCVSLKVYNMSSVQSQLSEGLKQSEALNQKSLADFQEKSALIESLRQAKTPEFLNLESSLELKLKGMQQSLTNMTLAQKKMSNANGQVAALSYTHRQVESDSAEYPKVSDALNRFTAANKEMTTAALNYSNLSHDLDDQVGAKKLFTTVDVLALQKRLDETLKAAQKTQTQMKKQLVHANETLGSSPDATSQEPIFAEMNTLAEDFTRSAQGFAQISEEIPAATLKSAQVSSLDPQWPQLQALLGRFASLQAELKLKSEQFDAANERFQTPFKRARSQTSP